MFPKEWQLCKIGDIAETTSGGTPSRKNKEYYDGNISWVKSGELEDGDIYSTEEKITEEALKKSSAKLFPKGTLLIAMYGATAGKTSILQIDATTNQAVCAIFPSKDLANAHFLRYYFIYSRPTLLRQRYGGAQPNISQTVIRNFEVSLPTISEQHNIAHILSQIQSAIETQEKTIQTTTELKKALMQKLFTEGLRGEPQKETEIGLVPESWEVKVFEDIVTLQRGKDLPKDKFVQGEFPVGGSNGIIGYHNQFNTKAPGITVGRSGSCGKVVFYDKNFWAHNTALVVKDFHGNNEKFIYYFLCSLKLEKYKSGVSVPTLNRNAFRTINMAIPKIDEQIEIAKTLEQTDKKINMAIEKKNVLQSLFKSMLHHLMTGQIRVKDLRVS